MTPRNMKSNPRLVGLYVGLIVLAAAPLCTASPPFGGDDGGFVPPDKNTAKCEDLVATHLKKLSACMMKCQIKQADFARKGKQFDEEACEQGTGKPVSCRAAFDNASAKLLGRKTPICPACLDATAQSNLADLVVNFIDTNNGLIYCGGAPPPGTVTSTSNPLWTDTGVDLVQGATFSITATGSWNWGQAPSSFGPDGDPASADGASNWDEFFTPALHGELIGFIGSVGLTDAYFRSQPQDCTGCYFAVGSTFTGQASTSGRLYLGFNDDHSGDIGDNVGSVQATIGFTD